MAPRGDKTHPFPSSSKTPTSSSSSSFFPSVVSFLSPPSLSFSMEAETRLSDLPEAILTNIFSLLTDTRTRNSVSLVCRRWLAFDRATRTHLSLRGNVRNLYLIPTSFRSVTHLDLSHISPWGYPLLHSSADPSLLALRLAHAFPSLLSLALYARTPTTLALIAPHFPNLLHVKLVRWHQRTQTPLGSDFSALFQNCPSLVSLDLSHFYYWTEDLPPALQANPLAASSLSRLNLLSLSSPEGFKSHEILAIAATCRNLRHLLAACVFDPRLVDFVGDEAVVQLASSCPKLELLHLADASTLDGARPDPDDDGYAQEDARITGAALEEVFDRLPLLEELALDVGHNIRASGSALEKLNSKCPKLRSLTLGWFHGVCEAVAPRLDGIALCRGLESLSVKCCADLNDFSLIAIAQGCPRLSKFEIQGCKMVTETGLRKFAGILKRVLVEVRISSCKNLGAAAVLCGLGPVRERIRRLHIDCCWDGPDQPDSPGSNTFLNFDLNESEPSSSPELIDFLGPTEKKCRYSDESGECSMNNYNSNGRRQLSASVWKRLKYLSIWIPVGELLTPLPLAGLDCCPELEEIRIKVEGDCRSRPKPAQWAFGLTTLARYPRLAKMQLDCGEVIGYALTAPAGHMDLSLWDRFYLNGIGDMKLRELDYWPPQDRDVNQRSLSLPAAGSLAQCATLRKLFIHGTTHEHFMRFFFQIPNLRDMQLREDYYPAPENDTSTEMRVDSCGRFEDALNSRYIRD